MTYEELLVENLRLRARIRELEQENARLKGYGSSLLCEPEPPQYGNGPAQEHSGDGTFDSCCYGKVCG